MSKSLKLVIRNAKKGEISEQQTGTHSQNPPSNKSLPPCDFTEKLNQLQGNLRMLERRYRSNLKQGFDNKIKAYRLQAVVQRKLLKQAIQETQRANERQKIIQKIQLNVREKKQEYSRALISQIQRQERIKSIKQRNFKEKRGLSLSLHERRASLDKQIRQIHEKIICEQSRINKKKDFFDFIRKAALKKQQLETKRQILTKIVTNTQRLQSLKNSLQDMRKGQQKQQTFLTI